MHTFSNGIRRFRGKRLAITYAALFALGGCGDGAEQQLTGGVTPTDAAALDEAAAKLDAENQNFAPQPMPQAGSKPAPEPSK